MIVFLNSWWISTVVVTIFQCSYVLTLGSLKFCRCLSVLLLRCANQASRPAASYWDSNIHPDYCINKSVFNIITGVINTVSDFLVYLWPVQFLWNIRLPVKHRVGVIFMFVIGCG
jgi:hypothetical protein